jgi:hypothetical protein
MSVTDGSGSKYKSTEHEAKNTKSLEERLVGTNSVKLTAEKVVCVTVGGEVRENEETWLVQASQDVCAECQCQVSNSVRELDF